MQRQSAAVGFSGSADTFQVVAAVAAAAGQAVGGKLHGLCAVVFKPQHHKAVLGVDGRADQPFFWVLLGQHTLGGVVQRCSNDGAYLPDVYKRQICTIIALYKEKRKMQADCTCYNINSYVTGYVRRLQTKSALPS